MNRIPPPRIFLTNGNGEVTREWYQYLLRNDVDIAQMDNVANSIASLAHTAVQPAVWLTHNSDAQQIIANQVFGG